MLNMIVELGTGSRCRNRSSGISGFADFWFLGWCRLHICFSHDSVIGFIGVGGGSLKIFYLHLMSWRVGQRHVLLENSFFSSWGSRNMFFFFGVIG